MSSKKDNGLTSSYVFIEIVAVFWLVALLLGKSPFYPVIVNGESMETTLYDDDKGYVLPYETINRYDIIVFHKVIDGKDTLLVKRVIGMPGDVVECKSHILYVNGEPALEFAKDPTKNTDFSAIKVPENCYFTLGDNREVSLDSRYEEVGFARRAELKGVFHKI